MNTFEHALLLDVVAVVICFVMLLRYGNLTFSHLAIADRNPGSPRE